MLAGSNVDEDWWLIVFNGGSWLMVVQNGSEWFRVVHSD